MGMCTVFDFSSILLLGNVFFSFYNKNFPKYRITFPTYEKEISESQKKFFFLQSKNNKSKKKNEQEDYVYNSCTCPECSYSSSSSGQ